MNIPGITQSSGPVDLNNIRGALTLPGNFPVAKFACKWTKKGPAVDRDQQREHIIGTPDLVADGWTVWLDPKTKKPCERTLSNGTQVLMIRPIALQKALQKIRGNISRDRMEKEQKGETVGGEPRVDRGIYSHDDLKKVPGLGSEGDEEMPVMRNQVGDLEEETSAKVSSRRS